MNFKRPLILASNSPRRQYLLQALGYQFKIQKPNSDETFPEDMSADEVPVFLARKKADSIELKNDEVALTSDTVVILDNQILNKPLDRDDAISMLKRLSGKTHSVITAFCIKDKDEIACYKDRSEVTFHQLQDTDITHYVDTFKPFDKAGAYGAQDTLPKGLNPCSAEEISFLKKMNKLDLIEKTFTNTTVGSGIIAINKIEGSYFNVMGLPIHKVHEVLGKL